MSSNSVIIFGPTGNIGSVAAATALEHGAQVFLAMRDTSKTIPGFTAEQDKAATRIEADLLDPESVTRSVQESGAKRAFTYVIHQSEDHMLSTFQALKAGGIEFVVFLSSYTVRGDRASIPPSEIIGYIHAQAELSLEKVFGDNYVAIRPGAFATNTRGWTKRVSRTTGDFAMVRPDVCFDYITPLDMGRVAASLLVSGKKGNEKFVYLIGPEQVSQRDAIGIIAKVQDKSDVNVVPVRSGSSEDSLKVLMEDMPHAPEPIAKYLLSSFEKLPDGPKEFDQAWVDNIQKYGGKAPTTYKTWVEDNKALFLA